MLVKSSEFRSKLLEAYGAGTKEIAELSAYNQNIFQHDLLSSSQTFPLEPEAHVAAWLEYLETAQQNGVLPTLKNVLVQLNFPIQAGISQTEAYRSATLKGVDPSTICEATGLVLQQPGQLKFKIHPSMAGTIPVLLPGNREDFETLLRALTKRNEPVPIPPSMGACMVAGYNNWDRIRRYRQQWSEDNPLNCSENAWKQEFKSLIPQKSLYQDRFIILSDGFYSNVSPKEIELTESEWRSFSLTIRLEHECTHYFTRRLFNSMQNNLLDELIADYRGIVAALGYYRADWFLRFMGLESFPDYRESGRLQNYRGQPPLSDSAFKILQALVVAAANNLEYFDRHHAETLNYSQNQPLILMALTYLTLEELASEQAYERLQQIFRQLQAKSA